MLRLATSKTFVKSLKKRIKSGCFDRSKLDIVLNKLTNETKLEQKYREHGLIGKMSGLIECHLEPDLLLVYEIDNTNKILRLINLGSHSELFD